MALVRVMAFRLKTSGSSDASASTSASPASRANASQSRLFQSRPFALRLRRTDRSGQKQGDPPREPYGSSSLQKCVVGRIAGHLTAAAAAEAGTLYSFRDSCGREQRFAREEGRRFLAGDGPPELRPSETPRTVRRKDAQVRQLAGARWWIRTTDPRRVKAVLYR
jgi:hypothetical protein